MTTWVRSCDRQTAVIQTASIQIASDEQALYQHWLECVEQESPQKLLHRFRTLFIRGVGYPEVEIWRSLSQIVASDTADHDFRFVLNRCCYILINRWLMQPRYHAAVGRLVHLFEQIPTSEANVCRTTKRLRELVKAFTTTEQYRALQRLTQIIDCSVSESRPSGSQPLRTLIHRYPCLYEHSLLTEDNTEEERRKIRLMRVQAQRQFEVDLVRYTTRQHRPNAIIRNPTLLSDRQLDFALKQFTGKVDGSNTYQDLAKQFMTYSHQTSSYHTFKQELYAYITDAVDSKYGSYQFNRRLYQYLQDTLPQSDDQALSDTLIVSTCRRLVNFLVIDSLHQPNHAVFVDLSINLGTTATIGLLLKIALFCHRIKPYLERQFSVLFRHYEGCTKDSVVWLIEAFENLNIALSLHFSTGR